MKKFLIISNACFVVFILMAFAIINAKYFDRHDAMRQHSPLLNYWPSDHPDCSEKTKDPFRRALGSSNYIACNGRNWINVGIDSRQEFEIYATRFLKTQKKICIGQHMLGEINVTLTNTGIVLASGEIYFQEKDQEVERFKFARVMKGEKAVDIGIGQLEIKANENGYDFILSNKPHNFVEKVMASEIDYYEDHEWYAAIKRYIAGDEYYHLLWSDELDSLELKHGIISGVIYNALHAGKTLKEIGCDIGKLE